MLEAEKVEPMQISVIVGPYWVTIEKPLSIMKNSWKLQQKSVIGAGKEEAMEISVLLTSHWVTIRKPFSIMKNSWKLL